MSLAVCTMSHSPLIGEIEPSGDVMAEWDAAVAVVRDRIAEFDPEVTVAIGPDHYNGVFYDMMPAFCIGTAARSVGDWRTQERELPVDAEAASALIRAVLDSGLDVARSERLRVDHGIEQTLEMIFGTDYARPVVPVFVNAVGFPLGPMRRIRLLGEAIGREAATWGKRVLVVGSGGLSHDPPVPRLDGASSEVRERLVDGRDPTADQRAVRQAGVIAAARAHAATAGPGSPPGPPVNPAFDALVMDTLAGGRVRECDGWSNEWLEAEGGGSAHEIRSWVAAFAALSGPSAPRVAHRWYRPVQEWATGMGIMLTEAHTPA
ncbi:3-carboxyethylcatechol 2,3-dioxygenase [Streptomyces abyssomicinicus]|uniref:3-carboxyethylcatechol 2,3-dioxygenase n=1 Tax=Streptomyces abyssomicinicus TaxID=574929 RepID=UPI00124FE101|nr:3-carboxyethylcatechol 2,3-dioxygenase [Streptomyces abyssomicinicus]